MRSIETATTSSPPALRPEAASSDRRPIACRLNRHGQSLHSWRMSQPAEAEPLTFDAAAALTRAGQPARAMIAPEADEADWLQFELALGLFGLHGASVDLDQAKDRLGANGARRFVTRAAAISARRGSALLALTNRSPAACVMRRECGARPPCMRLVVKG